MFLDNNLIHLLVLAPIAAVIYYLLPRRAQNYWLLLISYVFYATLHWAFPVALLLMTLVNFVLAQELAAAASLGLTRRKRLVLISGIVVNIALMALPKYSGVLISHLPA